MYTIQQIAQEITTLKPDFTDFIQVIQADTQNLLMQDIKSTSNKFEKALKAEVALTYYQTHNQRYLDSKISLECVNILMDLTGSSIYAATGSLGLHNTVRSYALLFNGKFTLSTHILAHITDVKPYLPKYLWNKVRTKKEAEALKQPAADEFSFMAFKTYLSKLPKGLNSVQALSYLSQTTRFPNGFAAKYRELIIDNCPKPSLKLQGSGYIPGLSSMNKGLVYKYMKLDRYYLRGLAREHNLFVNKEILDDRESDYKPFVINMERTPTPDDQQFNYLFNALMILKYAQSVNPQPAYPIFIEQLTEHLKHPDYANHIAKYKRTLTNSVKAITEINNIF